MSAWAKTAWVTTILLCFLLSVPFARRIDPRPGAPARAREENGAGSLLVEFSRRPAFALGFRNFLADLLWLEAVQVSGTARMSRGDYDRLFTLLNAVANYDPRFEIPYIMGGLILGNSPAHGREALSILERGLARYPERWLFHYYIGYTYYFSLGNPVDGGRSMMDAARLPGSPRYLAGLATRMLSEGREPATALDFLATMEREETDEARRELLRRRIRDVLVERDIQALEHGVAEYRGATGRLPGSLAELVRTGLIAGIPREPNGGAYHLLPDGTVRSDRVEGRLKVFQVK